MKDISKKRNYYINKRNVLEEKKKDLVKFVNKELRELNLMCGHNIMFLIHYETVNKNKYFIRSYCPLCGRTIFINKLDDSNYHNLIDVYPIISKFIPAYVKDEYKICIINEVVDSINNNYNPSSYEELTNICNRINKELLSKINDINSFSELQNEFIKCIQNKKRSLKK